MVFSANNIRVIGIVAGLEIGSEDWWQERRRQKGPLIVCEGERCTVIFYWRDPAGDETTSQVRHVWIYITGVTDHHQQMQPQSLVRIPGTDVWQWQTHLNATWRGSYCLIPSSQEDDFAPEARQNPPDRRALREGWRRLLPQAIADPLNSDSWYGGRGHPVSALHLPQAPMQTGWENVDASPHSAPPPRIWHSKRLGNQRRVWVFTTGECEPEKRPLAILLDGQFWAERMPIWDALAAETRAGRLPPAVYLLVDVIDIEHRRRELTCNPIFWLAVQEELLPLLASQGVQWRDDPSTTVVAGQSFGGLSALYAALYWPQRFGCVLSQSGSFWWPRQDNSSEAGWLVKKVQDGLGEGKALRIFLEAGVREPLILQVNDQLSASLEKNHSPSFYRQFDGGHDALCWRGGLTEGLNTLWSALIVQPA